MDSNSQQHHGFSFILGPEEILKVIPGVQKKTFVFNLRRGEYEREYGRDCHPKIDELLGKLVDRKFADVSADLRANLLAYYADGPRPALIEQQIALLTAYRVPPLDDAQQHHDDGDHQQHVEQPAHRVGRDHPEEP